MYSKAFQGFKIIFKRGFQLTLQIKYPYCNHLTACRGAGNSVAGKNAELSSTLPNLYLGGIFSEEIVFCFQKMSDLL